MTVQVSALLYCVLIFLAALVGGLVPLYWRPSHTRMQIALSFVAGVMLGVGLLNLMPHAFFSLGSIERVAFWVLAGFLVLFFMQRVFHFHHHDVPDESLPGHGNVAEHDHDHHHECAAHGHHHHERAPTTHQLSWGGAMFGMAIHSLVDGLALGAGILADWQTGLAIMLAILLHKPFDSLTIGLLMSSSGYSLKTRHIINTLFALVSPVGVAIFFLGVRSLGDSSGDVIGIALSFAAGAFLCIATSDLLPELQFHSHDRLKLSTALLAGIALAWAIETYGHDHSHHDHGSHSHQGNDHSHEGHDHSHHGHKH